ncbi:uroporphyrinogen-III synthase [Thalassotalea fusca]
MAKNKLTALITRPHPYDQRLAQQLNQANVNTICQPVFCYQASNASLSRELAEYDVVVFISAAAVNYCAAAGKFTSLTNNKRHTLVLAVGNATRQALAEQGIEAISPERHDTEGLLALTCLQATNIINKEVLIVRGDGGRECLATQLKTQGAQVTYWESYQRVWLDLPHDIAHTWQQSGVNCFIITSNNILKYVVNLLKRADNYWENNAMLVVASERIAHTAKTLGFHQIINAQGASDEAIISAIRKIGLNT